MTQLDCQLHPWYKSDNPVLLSRDNMNQPDNRHTSNLYFRSSINSFVSAASAFDSIQAVPC